MQVEVEEKVSDMREQGLAYRDGLVVGGVEQLELSRCRDYEVGRFVLEI